MSPQATTPPVINAEKVTATVRQSEAQSTAITATFLEQIAQNPAITPEKLEHFMKLRDQEEAKWAKRSFMAAMAQVQEKIPVVIRDAKNTQTQSKYATEEAIARAIKPIFTKEGFSLSFDTQDCARKDHMRVVCIVRHRDGHEETRGIDYPYDIAGIKGTPNKTPIHAYKSTLSYARNTLTCMVFNVATGHDDDGNGAGKGTSKGNGSEGNGLITDAQAGEIEKLLKDPKANRKSVLKWLATKGIDGIENIPAAQFAMVVGGIQQSLAKAKNGGGQ